MRLRLALKTASTPRVRRRTVSAAGDRADGRLRVSSRASLRRVQLRSLTDECPQRRFIDHVPLTEINGAHGGAVKPGVEHVLRVLQQRALRERQARRALE